MAKVYVVKENPKLDYSDAERYGEIVFLTDREYSTQRNSINNDILVKQIRQSLYDFNPDQDFLLLTGNPVVLSWAFYNALLHKGYLNVLQWDNRQQAYSLIHFNPEKGEKK